MSLSVDSNEYSVGTDKVLTFTIDEEGLNLHEDNYTITVVFSKDKNNRLFQLTGTALTDPDVEEVGKKFKITVPDTHYYYFEIPGRYYMRVFLEDNDGDLSEKGELHLWVKSGPNKA